MNNNINRQKLKPCPFCGGIAIVDMDEDWYWEWKAFCTKCGCDLGYFKTKEEAIKAWNKRADRPAAYNVEAVVKKLESRILKSTTGIYAADVHNNAIEDAISIVREGVKNENR